jgi:hypothetical protein
MSAGVKVLLPDFLEAIKASRGIKVTIAKRLGISRQTVDVYLKKWESAKTAYDEEVDLLGDEVENRIIDVMFGDDIELAIQTCKWYAAKKLKHRGYVDRQEVGGANDGPVSIRVTYDAAVDDQIVQKLNRLAEMPNDDKPPVPQTCTNGSEDVPDMSNGNQPPRRSGIRIYGGPSPRSTLDSTTVSQDEDWSEADGPKSLRRSVSTVKGEPEQDTVRLRCIAIGHQYHDSETGRDFNFAIGEKKTVPPRVAKLLVSSHPSKFDIY